jgi:hypothetical protein
MYFPVLSNMYLKFILLPQAFFIICFRRTINIELFCFQAPFEPLVGMKPILKTIIVRDKNHFVIEKLLSS